jgi:hypothetical protein
LLNGIKGAKFASDPSAWLAKVKFDGMAFLQTHSRENEGSFAISFATTAPVRPNPKRPTFIDIGSPLESDPTIR